MDIVYTRHGGFADNFAFFAKQMFARQIAKVAHFPLGYEILYRRSGEALRRWLVQTPKKQKRTWQTQKT
jgi:hypothetical protein